MKRLLGGVLALALVAGVVVLIASHCCSRPTPGAVTRVSGLIGSEKTNFFADPAVAKALSDQHLGVSVDHAGSWQMADLSKKAKYDFAIPSTDVIGADIPNQVTTVPVRPFYSPLVLVAQASTVDALDQLGLVRRRDDGVTVFLTRAYLDLVKAGHPSWNDVKGHPELSGKVLVSTTDPQSSGSAALYLATLAYLDLGNNVVTDPASAAREGTALKGFFGPQGALLASSDQLVGDFIAGAGKPLIWTYESEVAERARAGTLPKDTVVLYPDTTIQSDHTVVELTPQAHQLALALQSDPALVKLEADHGFRPETDPGAFAREMGATVQANHFVANVADLKSAQANSPTGDLLKAMINAATGKNS
ncbi:hypothetical protein C7C46_02885 [Streptomyces tateyamensis]|uniref:ABC transporter substrate-binding protein n=1 Tax=Streptomyces tateyamensis TaxID=565073 RepID=A0A2V4NV70_9ACTN|nr:hypothetical protein [Streptomyces tateyamensis]PYC87711.1 hypothetical protein C7C46_02885 [Streptomyces tateyamensis]